MESVILAVELPVSLLYLSKFTNYDFVIASYYQENKDYADFYRKSREDAGVKRFTILDNGAFETGKSILFDDYIKIIEELSPDEIVLPDVVNDAYDTLDLVEKFLKRVVVTMHIPRLMGVLQGKCVNDYLYCLEYYIRQSKEYSIKTIGIPYHLFYRPTLLRKTNIIELCKEHNLAIHILGLPNPYEILDLRKFGKIITSVDTSLPVSAASQGMVLEDNQWPLGGRVSITSKFEKVDVFIVKNLTEYNIRFLKLLCSEG